MALVSNWQEVLQKAWSVRFAIVAAFCSGFEAMCMALDGQVLGLPTRFMAGLGAMFAASGVVARVLDQAQISPKVVATESTENV